MFKKRNNHTFIFLVSSCLVLISIFSATLYLFHDSYAINVDSSTGLPSGTFTSNYAGSAKTNLISTALNGGGSYSTSVHNFDIASNFKTSDSLYPLYSLMKNLKFPTTNEKFELIDNNPLKVNDKGLLYILSHGYNSTNTTNNVFSTNTYGGVTDNSVKEYITQIAVWLYLFEHKGNFTSNYCIDAGDNLNSCDFYINSGGTTIMNSTTVRQIISEAAKVNGYNYLNYITLLVDNANKYNGSSTSTMTGFASKTISYTISNTNKSLITEAITPSPNSNTENYLYYSVKLNDPNNYGVYLLDSSNNKLTNTTNLTGAFKIYVPLKDDISTMDLSSISIDITGTFIKADGYSYRVTSSTSENLINKNKKQAFADVLLGYVPIETATVNLSLRNIVKISKIDAADSKELPGATLVITNKKDNSTVEKWVSTNTAKYIFLENGDYTLCETIAPKGYALSTECIDFKVDGTKIVSAKMENHKEVEVPNTAANMSKIIYLVGGILLFIGLSFISIIISKKTNIKKIK